MNINNIIPNCFVCLFAVAGVKESEIRLPPGLLNVNSLPTYFQLTSNQQALFRGANNRNKTFHAAWKSRWARLGIRDRSAIDLNQKIIWQTFIFRNERNIYEAIRSRMSL